MRRIGIRQFEQNFHKEIKNLPFTVTKNGEDYCVVTLVCKEERCASNASRTEKEA